MPNVTISRELLQEASQIVSDVAAGGRLVTTKARAKRVLRQLIEVIQGPDPEARQVAIPPDLDRSIPTLR